MGRGRRKGERDQEPRRGKGLKGIDWIHLKKHGRWMALEVSYFHI